MVKTIVYIAGDGRSGSTLLESILANAPNSIGIGEAYRYFLRFYESDTLCGCSNKIEQCYLWSYVHEKIITEIPNFDHNRFWLDTKFLLFQKNFNKIPKYFKSKEWEEYKTIVRIFYESIFERTEKNILIDSSKSVGWLRILQELDICNLQIIHLERNLASVANSWKKKIYLPEYYDKEVLMPIKSNFIIVKSWFKIKYNMKTFREDDNYHFISYERFVKDPNSFQALFEKIVNVELNFKNLYFPKNHAIGGNPMRNIGNKKLLIDSSTSKLNNLSKIEISLFRALNRFGI